MLIANKADLVEDADEELEILEDLAGISFPTLSTSVETGDGLDRLGPWLFEQLGIVRVYTKIPGAEPDMGRPFTVRKGQTVGDVAMLVHKRHRRLAQVRPHLGDGILRRAAGGQGSPRPGLRRRRDLHS